MKISESTTTMQAATWLRNRLEALDISQATLARKAGVSVPYICSRLSKGLSYKALAKLCVAMSWPIPAFGEVLRIFIPDRIVTKNGCVYLGQSINHELVSGAEGVPNCDLVLLERNEGRIFLVFFKQGVEVGRKTML